jgi:hypothetical protein
VTESAGTINLQLSEGFFKKLKANLEVASRQMVASDSANSARKMIYIVVNFDDNLNEYADDYSAQIDSFITANPVPPEIEIVCHIKPPFYSATV